MNKIFLVALLASTAFSPVIASEGTHANTTSGTFVGGGAAGGALSFDNSGPSSSRQSTWADASNRTSARSTINSSGHSLSTNTGINSRGWTNSGSRGVTNGSALGGSGSVAGQYGVANAGSGGSVSSQDHDLIYGHHYSSDSEINGDAYTSIGGAQGSVATTSNVGTGEARSVSDGYVYGSSRAKIHVNATHTSTSVTQGSGIDVTAGGWATSTKTGGGGGGSAGGGIGYGYAGTNAYSILSTMDDGTMVGAD